MVNKADRWAIVDQADGTVTGIILWDGETPWTPPDGQQAIRVVEGDQAAPGAVWNGRTFTAPAVADDLETSSPHVGWVEAGQAIAVAAIDGDQAAVNALDDLRAAIDAAIIDSR